MVCGHCHEETIPLEMYGHNAKLVEAALAATPAAVSRALLKTLREKFGISQRDASKMFGAGEASFAKWESGQTEMSGPAALLAQCALHVPGVMEYLANLSDVKMDSQRNFCTDSSQLEYSHALKDADVVNATAHPLRGRMYLVKPAAAPRAPWTSEYTPTGDLRLAA